MRIKEFFTGVGKKLTPAYITKVALLTGLSYILYLFVKIKLPMIFPVFLEMQISELPAILAGFSLGPAAGTVVIILRSLLKFPLSTTVYVGELTDMILGILFVLPAALIYKRNKTKKSALIALGVGTLVSTVGAMLLNYFVSVPFYVEAYFGGDFGAIVGMLSALYKNITVENFYVIYLFAGILPFNILRLTIVSILTFLLYKRLSKVLHWELLKKRPYAEPQAENEEVLVEASEENNEDKGEIQAPLIERTEDSKDKEE